MSFFNTTQETGEQLKLFKKKANAQDNKVLNAFIDKERPLGASDVYRALNRTILLTSVRRSINTLTNLGVLKKTDIKKQGMFGRPEKTWELWNA